MLDERLLRHSLRRKRAAARAALLAAAALSHTGNAGSGHRHALTRRLGLACAIQHSVRSVREPRAQQRAGRFDDVARRQIRAGRDRLPGAVLGAGSVHAKAKTEKVFVTFPDATFRFITERRIELVGGSWSVPDEASTHYASLIANFMEGHEWLLQTFGEHNSRRG